MTLQRQREKRKRRRGGGDVSDIEQPGIVQRLSQEAHDVHIGDLKARTASDDDVGSGSELEGSGSELDLSPKDTAYSPSKGAEEKKEDGAHCKRFDEGSHSDSSQMDEASSSELPAAKEHAVIIPEHEEHDGNNGMLSNSGILSDSEQKPTALENQEKQDLLQKNKTE